MTNGFSLSKRSARSLTVIALALVPMLSSAQTRFIETHNVGGDSRIGLYLAEGHDVVSTSHGVPQVRMRLDTTNEMITVPKGNIKVEVYRTTDEEPELVAVFNYPVKQGQDHIDLKMNLPEFKNQSENFDFVVYDTNGNARAKYRHSFASKELITLQPKPPTVEVPDDQSLDAKELEYVAKKFAISVVPSGQPTGMQKKDGVYNFQIPLRRARAKVTQRNKINTSSLDFDEVGTLAERAQFDNAEKGTVFLDETTGLVYVKASDKKGDWSTALDFLGGDNGQTQSPSVTTVISNPTTTIVQQLDVNQITNGSISVEKIETVIRDQVLSLSLKDALRTTGAMFGTVAGASMPVIRYISTGSASWSFVLPQDLVRNDLSHNNVKVKILWSPSNSSSNAVDWRLNYSSYNNGDLLSASAVHVLNTSSVAPSTALTLTETEFLIPIADLKSQLTLKLERTDSRDIKPNLVSLSIEYPGRSLE